jgi:hypothetical protein
MSCVSGNKLFPCLFLLVFAFVDKEGIISETAKYVDEMAVIDKHQ